MGASGGELLPGHLIEAGNLLRAELGAMITGWPLVEEGPGLLQMGARKGGQPFGVVTHVREGRVLQDAIELQPLRVHSDVGSDAPHLAAGILGQLGVMEQQPQPPLASQCSKNSCSSAGITRGLSSPDRATWMALMRAIVASEGPARRACSQRRKPTPSATASTWNLDQGRRVHVALQPLLLFSRMIRPEASTVPIMIEPSEAL